ncbi:MAG: ComF family protein [Parcubacteria group bacterium]|jgi:ComF family protein
MEKHNPPYDGVFVASYFKDPLVRKMIHYFKYRFVKDLSHPLALLMAQALHNSHFPAPDLIIPIPLHARRLRWRGFNQAEEIARSLDLHIPLNTDILKRIRYTHPQVTMRDKESREDNVHNAFAVHDPSLIRGKNILLVDDIMTTGATITACATVLKNSGAGNIYAIVIARE